MEERVERVNVCLVSAPERDERKKRGVGGSMLEGERPHIFLFPECREVPRTRLLEVRPIASSFPARSGGDLHGGNSKEAHDQHQRGRRAVGLLEG